MGQFHEFTQGFLQEYFCEERWSIWDNAQLPGTYSQHQIATEQNIVTLNNAKKIKSSVKKIEKDVFCLVISMR